MILNLIDKINFYIKRYSVVNLYLFRSSILKDKDNSRLYDYIERNIIKKVIVLESIDTEKVKIKKFNCPKKNMLTEKLAKYDKI